MIAGVATETMVVSTRIMKKPRQRAKRAGHGRMSSPLVAVVGAGAVRVTASLNTRPGTLVPRPISPSTCPGFRATRRPGAAALRVVVDDHAAMADLLEPALRELAATTADRVQLW